MTETTMGRCSEPLLDFVGRSYGALFRRFYVMDMLGAHSMDYIE